MKQCLSKSFNNHIECSINMTCPFRHGLGQSVVVAFLFTPWLSVSVLVS